ncbi:PH domain-containing protein [Georgenia phoenicis]|uniref:PH domain-containing protein n=1 Tax=unclassified Georgenia TaxID=2626815 RepID=UPI0039B0B08C
MQPAIVFRASASRGYAVATWVVAVAVLAAFAVNGGAEEVLRYGALPLLLAVLGWTAFWRPLVRVERDGVRVVNVISTTWLPWAAVTGTRTRWGLEITTHGRPVGAWALPSRSAISRWTSGRGEAPAAPPPLRTIDADVPGGGDPHVAARVIEEHLTRGSAQPERQLDIVPAGVLLATAGLALASLLL